MEIHEILESLEAGKITVNNAKKLLSLYSIEEVEGFAKIDINRRKRRGIPEVIFAEPKELDELVLNTKQVAAKVIELKGATVHAPGNAISAILESVVRDRKQVIPVATYIDGEYGHSDVTIGVPAIIGKKGVEKIIELDLNDEERQGFDKGVESVKEAISGIEI